MRQKKLSAIERYMASHPLCLPCQEGNHDRCNGSARLPDEYHPLGVMNTRAFPAFAPCECIHILFEVPPGEAVAI